MIYYIAYYIMYIHEYMHRVQTTINQFYLPVQMSGLKINIKYLSAATSSHCWRIVLLIALYKQVVLYMWAQRTTIYNWIAAHDLIKRENNSLRP